MSRLTSFDDTDMRTSTLETIFSLSAVTEPFMGTLLPLQLICSVLLCACRPANLSAGGLGSGLGGTRRKSGLRRPCNFDNARYDQPFDRREIHSHYQPISSVLTSAAMTKCSTPIKMDTENAATGHR